MAAELRRRVEPLFAAARRLATSSDAAARRARERLTQSSGLSAEGVELALALSLERSASDAELAALASSVPTASNAHVLLSANVFVATQRAIALGLASAPRVFVRPSRREPEMARWYSEAAPGLFELVEQLAPGAGDAVFAFGGAAALQSIIPTLPSSAVRAYGPGFGLEVCAAPELEADERRAALARDIALDCVLFDQRGCLSPRLVLVQGSMTLALALARDIARELEASAARVPLGRLAPDEQAEITRYCATMTYAGELLTSAAGSVGVAAFDAPTLLSPLGRTLHVAAVSDAIARARSLARDVTTAGVAGDAAFSSALAAALPEARLTTPGRLQRPAFDGPVDRRQRPLSAWAKPPARA